MVSPPLGARRKKRLLVASVGVATVSFACGQRSDRYETFTSGNLVAVPIEAGVDEVTAPDAGARPHPSNNLPEAGAHDVRPAKSAGPRWRDGNPEGG